MLSALVGRIYLLLLLFTTHAHTTQQEVNSAFVTVKVSDPSGNAVSDARVRFVERSSKAEKEQATDGTGKAAVQLQSGSFDLNVTSPRPDLMPLFVLEVEIKPGEHRQLDVVLKAKVPDIIDVVDFNQGLEPERAKLGNLEESAEVKIAIRGPVTLTGFHWNWKEWQELTANQSLRNAKLTQIQRKAIADAIAGEIRPMMADLEIKSDAELQKAALDTRIKLIDLNGDGVAEVLAQGMVACGATGNCPFWVLRKSKADYEVILEGEAQTFTVQASTNGYRDIVLSTHGSSTSGGLTHFQYQGEAYGDVGCYYYEWTVLEDENVRELKEPRVTPCK